MSEKQSRYGSPELQARIVAKALEKDAAAPAQPQHNKEINMSDLTDRLRCFDRQTCSEAADRIEYLERENAELKEQLRGGKPCASHQTNISLTM